jgi:UDPglucose 6-dehydrogenase
MIGIVGVGFVGSAIYNAYKIQNIKTVCRDPQKGFNSTIDDLMKTNGIFVSVPSPQFNNGSCNTTILESALEELKDYQGVIISKVTAPPDAYKKLIHKYPNLVHAPEFLVAATAKEDYINGEFAIIGGNKKYCEDALEIIKLGQPNLKKYRFCSIEEASLSKYAINCFLSTKVIFMNQMKEIADKIGADYDIIKENIKLDTRLGSSHFDVPGPDGSYGFGGACFPKDTAALLHYSKSIDGYFDLLEEVINVNKKIKKKKMSVKGNCKNTNL